MRNKDIDETAAVLTAIKTPTKAEVYEKYNSEWAEIALTIVLPPVCHGILEAGRGALEFLRDCANLEDDETGRFLMARVGDMITGASGITHGCTKRVPLADNPNTVH